MRRRRRRSAGAQGARSRGAGGRSGPGQGPGRTKDGDKGGAAGVGAGRAPAHLPSGAGTAHPLPAGAPPRYGNGVGNQPGGGAFPTLCTEHPVPLHRRQLPAGSPWGQLRAAPSSTGPHRAPGTGGDQRGLPPPRARSSRRRGALGPPAALTSHTRAAARLPRWAPRVSGGDGDRAERRVSEGQRDPRGGAGHREGPGGSRAGGSRG